MIHVKLRKGGFSQHRHGHLLHITKISEFRLRVQKDHYFATHQNYGTNFQNSSRVQKSVQSFKNTETSLILLQTTTLVFVYILFVFCACLFVCLFLLLAA